MSPSPPSIEDSKNAALRFSIVINTLNRAEYLQQTLESLQRLSYPGTFEVVVVAGPCTDATPDLLDEWKENIVIDSCPDQNLSRSRNIGIRRARGDIVCFLDDDALPLPLWLQDLAEAYRDPEVGAAGGRVLNREGTVFQHEYVEADSRGDAFHDRGRPSPNSASIPGSKRYPHLLGCNSSFRRDVLHAVGGFDEEFNYFLDETDLCRRIVNAGYRILQLPGAVVHHKYAPSAVRNEKNELIRIAPILKNKLYFMLKHSKGPEELPALLQHQRTFTDQIQKQMPRTTDKSEEAEAAFWHQAGEAWNKGLERGLARWKRPSTYEPFLKATPPAGEILPFPSQGTPDPALQIALVCQHCLGPQAGGVGRLMWSLAKALAGSGHHVYLITETQADPYVQLLEGVWVHEIRTVSHALPEGITPKEQVPAHWNWSESARLELERLRDITPIDLVEAPIWNGEGIAFLHADSPPLITNLQTTVHFYQESHPELAEDPHFQDFTAQPMLRVERDLFLNSDGIRCITDGIRRDIEAAYNLTFREESTRTLYPCLEDVEPPSPEQLPPENPTILFVGRLEPRKGIDLLLRSLPSIANAVPNVLVRIIGKDHYTEPEPYHTYEEWFKSEVESPGNGCSVIFEGGVSDEVLQKAYRECTVLAAPSRFESFGYIYVEAMRCGKPTVGCRVGGIPEVVEDGKTGLLVPPDDVEALSGALQKLLLDPETAQAFGQAGRLRYEERFRPQAVADGSIAFYRECIQRTLATPDPT